LEVSSIGTVFKYLYLVFVTTMSPPYHGLNKKLKSGRHMLRFLADGFKF